MGSCDVVVVKMYIVSSSSSPATAHVSLPSRPEDEGLYVVEGVNPVVIAADDWGEGHVTDYPGDQETVALQIPFRDGKVPAHEVVGERVCELEVGKGRWRELMRGQAVLPLG